VPKWLEQAWAAGKVKLNGSLVSKIKFSLEKINIYFKK